MTIVHEKHGRLQWVDVLRGVLILSVVIGHATGKYNHYIYQFHMGAFFILSGFVSAPEKKTVLHTIYYKFFTNYLPLLSSIVLFSFISEILCTTGHYSLFFDEGLPHLGFWEILKAFFKDGFIYSWLLGASWFLFVLFGAAIVNRILLAVCNEKYGIPFFVLSIAVFLLGYSFAEAGENKRNIDLILIAQFYLMLGEYLRALMKDRLSNSSIAWDLIGLLVSGGIMLLFSKYGISMDFSARRFNNPAIDILQVVNGTLFCYCVAKLFYRNELTNLILQGLGKNTLPIVFFHFATFKISYFMLYYFGRVPFSYLTNFVPTAEIGNTWWLFITVISIMTSLILWKVIMQFRIFRILWGQEKKVYDRIWTTLTEFVNKTAKRNIPTIIPVKIRNFGSFLMKKGVIAILCCLLVILMIANSYVSTYVGSTLETCKVEAGFHQDGWCEEYVKIRIRTGQTGQIDLTGWTNIELTGEEKITVLCNGEEIMQYTVQSSEIAFSLQAAPKSEVVLEISSNFSFDAAPPDIRKLAFILTTLDAT